MRPFHRPNAIRTFYPLVLLFAQLTTIQAAPPRRLSEFKEEKYEDSPSFIWRTDTSPRKLSVHGSFTSYQVNVSASGQNITGDAANEPSITMNPADPSRMSIGWRQFNSVSSNFRQGGYSNTTDGGQTWTFVRVLSNGFRSDPVLHSDALGVFFYLSLVPNFFDDIWRSSDWGQSWAQIAPATGGDKQWFTIDPTNSSGRGFQYQSWSTAGNNYGGRQFTRSTDSGLSWMDPIYLPNGPSWGTLDVDSAGNLFIGGVNLETGAFWCLRSNDAKNGAVVPTFSQSTLVNLGGHLVPGSLINPEGLSGQVYLAVDRSGTDTNNNLYMLASVQAYDAVNGTDVMFVRSTDGGASFSAPRRINDDPVNHNKWHWFGTLSVAPNGRLDVIWFDSRNAANDVNSQLFYSFSTNGGHTWSANVAVSEPFDPYLGYPNQQKIGDYIAIVSDAGGGNIAYCATFNLEQDIYYARVTPGAAVAPVAFTVRAITHDANGVSVTFPSQSGESYRCDYSDGPAGPWYVLQTNILGAGSDIVITDSGAAGKPERFYRIVRLP